MVDQQQKLVLSSYMEIYESGCRQIKEYPVVHSEFLTYGIAYIQFAKEYPGLFETIFSLNFTQGKEIVGVLSAVLPLLTLLVITEISKSVSFNMIELEMSCKYNLGKIMLIRLSTIGVFHFVILLLSLLLFKHQSQYGMFRYSLYAVTPFLLSSYLSFWITNHIKSKDTLYICSAVTAVVSIAVFAMSSNFTVIYTENCTLFWGIAFITIAVLLTKEIYFFLTERNKQWNFA